MFFIEKSCPLCQSGAVGFRLTSRRDVLLMCNECDAVWTSPNDVELKSAVFPSQPEFQVNSHGSVKSPDSQWAGLSDIRLAGFEQWICGEGKA